MKAAVFHELGKPLRVETVDKPKAGRGEILLKVHYCGICGSDLHSTHPGVFVVPDGTILGHEFAGHIAKVGSRVGGFKEGDRVVSETAAVLPSDSALIRQGLYNLEPNRLGFGYGVNGAMAPLVSVMVTCCPVWV